MAILPEKSLPRPLRRAEKVLQRLKTGELQFADRRQRRAIALLQAAKLKGGAA